MFMEKYDNNSAEGSILPVSILKSVDIIHPWLSVYIQGLLLNEKESLIPNDCHCGEIYCSD